MLVRVPLFIHAWLCLLQATRLFFQLITNKYRTVLGGMTHPLKFQQVCAARTLCRCAKGLDPWLCMAVFCFGQNATTLAEKDMKVHFVFLFSGLYQQDGFPMHHIHPHSFPSVMPPFLLFRVDMPICMKSL